jgi:hypothetical protein
MVMIGMVEHFNTWESILLFSMLGQSSTYKITIMVTWMPEPFDATAPNKLSNKCLKYLQFTGLLSSR